MALELDALDKRLLDAAQGAFPLCARPYAALGDACGCSEREVLERLTRLKEGRVLRQVSAIFDSKALGYRSALIAARAPAGRVEASAAVVSEHVGVSHNYEREHAYNLWFTLAVPPGVELQAEADRLGRRAGLERWQVLPALRTFRIGVRFDLAAGKATAAVPSAPAKPRPAAPPPGPSDRLAIRLLQEDLLPTPRPFLLLADQLGWDEERLFEWMADAAQLGWLRRFAAVLRHREAGFGEGGMGVWAAAPQDVEALGQAFAADPAVTHCYERPDFEGWPYRLFTMVHGRDRADCAAVLDGLAARVPGWTQRGVLYSLREFKKERVKYFLESSLTGGAS
jgi:DNA-binding Lrp family transcriptional regulator